MTENPRVRAVSGDVRERTLSLAVGVRDFVTGSSPVEDAVVTVEGVARSEAPSESGYHVFVDADVPASPFTVTVTCGDRYFEAERTVFVSRDGSSPPSDGPPSTVVLDESSPAFDVRLVPTPSYDFPPTTTVVRGFLRRPAPENPPHPETAVERARRGIGGAELSIERLDYAVRSTRSGEFALPIPLDGPVGTEREEFTEVLDDGGDAGEPQTRSAYRLWLTVDDETPVLSVKHDDVAPNSESETVATLPVQVGPRTTTSLELVLDEGEVRPVPASE